MYLDPRDGVHACPIDVAEVGMFIDRLLPDEALGQKYVALVAPAEGRPFHVSAESKASFTKVVAQHAVQNSVYALTGTVGGDATGRKAEDVVAKQALYLDLDCGAGKEYARPAEAAAALVQFVKDTGLPAPDVISSGGGIHAYWRFDAPVSASLWRSAAEDLSAMADSYGLQCDRQVTKDIARVMRVAGTMNWKPGVQRLAKFKKQAERQDFGRIATLLAQSRQVNGVAIAPATVLNTNSALTHGLEAASWASSLTSEQRGDLVEALLETASLTRKADGDRNGWVGCLSAIKHSNIDRDRAFALARGWSATSPKFDETDFENTWHSGLSGNNIGALIKAGGASPDGLRVLDQFKSLARGLEPAVHMSAAVKWEPQTVNDLPHTMSPEETISYLNSVAALVSHDGGATATLIRCSDGSWERSKGVSELLSNRFTVGQDHQGKSLRSPAYKYWMAHSGRRTVEKFGYYPEPHLCPAEPHLNMWTDPIGRLAGNGRQGSCRLIVRHLLEVGSRRDKVVWKYLIRWMAHAVQYPGSAPGTVIVLMSEREGTGKTFTGDLLVRMLGRHAAAYSTPEKLLQNFNAHLECLSVILLNEPTFAGDANQNRKLKSMITDATWTVEIKGGGVREIPNIAHIILTTNEVWSVNAGAGARRYLVLDLDPSKAGEPSYWKRLVAERDNGGLESFLRFLLAVDLKDFNPAADLPRTDALRDQQLRSAPAQVQWLLDMCDLGSGGQGVLSTVPIVFGARANTSDLFASYSDWAKARRFRPLSLQFFGRWLNDIGLSPFRSSGTRGYLLPDEVTLRDMVLKQSGIAR